MITERVLVLVIDYIVGLFDFMDLASSAYKDDIHIIK
jgi:hypothetical protein